MVTVKFFFVLFCFKARSFVSYLVIKNWVHLQHFICGCHGGFSIAYSAQTAMNYWNLPKKYLLYSFVLFCFSVNGPWCIITKSLSQKHFLQRGLLWTLLLGNTNPVWALLKSCWVKFQVLCPWAPLWVWTLDLSLSCFQLYEGSICKCSESPKSHTNK